MSEPLSNDEIDIGYEQWDGEPSCCDHCGADVDPDEWECWWCGGDLT